jgi:hypothetical protein
VPWSVSTAVFPAVTWSDPGANARLARVTGEEELRDAAWAAAWSAAQALSREEDPLAAGTERL